MRSPLDATAANLALDSRALETLKAEAKRDARAAAKAAAQQFEAVFLQQVLKQMRDTLPGTDPLASSASRMHVALFDQHLAARLAERGTGLAQAIARHLQRLLPTTNASAATGRESLTGQGAAQALAPRTALGAAERKSPPPAAVRSAAAANSAVSSGGAQDAAPVGPRPADSSGARSDFIDNILGYAKQAAQMLGVPAAFVVGQAALESAWGRREIVGTGGERSFNLFGIKAGAGWTGRTVEAITTEFVGGMARRVVQTFRAYASFEEAFADYGRLLANNPRYARGVVAAPDAASFAQALAGGGYATDPWYAAKLQRAIAAVQAAGARG
jgi:flagellar protein FlgJ